VSGAGVYLTRHSRVRSDDPTETPLCLWRNIDGTVVSGATAAAARSLWPDWCLPDPVGALLDPGPRPRHWAGVSDEELLNMVLDGAAMAAAPVDLRRTLPDRLCSLVDAAAARADHTVVVLEVGERWVEAALVRPGTRPTEPKIALETEAAPTPEEIARLTAHVVQGAQVHVINVADIPARDLARGAALLADRSDLRSREVIRLFDRWDEELDRLLPTVSGLRNLCRRLPLPARRELATRLQAGDPYQRAVLAAMAGQPAKTVVALSPFSWGKSTLLNALLGEPLLPAEERAETARVIRIRHADFCAAVLEGPARFQLHPCRTLAELAELVRDEASIRGEATDGVETVHVFLPLPRPLRRLELVDTPGYQFVFGQAHQELTDRIWPEADLLLVPVDPESIGQQAFTAQLARFRQAGKQVLYALTKRDAIQSDVNRLVHALRDAIAQPEAEVVPVSAYFALQGRLWKQGRISLRDVRRDPRLYVTHQGDLLQGADIGPQHVDELIRFSGITRLEERIAGITGGAAAE